MAPEDYSCARSLGIPQSLTRSRFLLTARQQSCRVLLATGIRMAAAKPTSPPAPSRRPCASLGAGQPQGWHPVWDTGDGVRLFCLCDEGHLFGSYVSYGQDPFSEFPDSREVGQKVCWYSDAFFLQKKIPNFPETRRLFGT